MHPLRNPKVQYTVPSSKLKAARMPRRALRIAVVDDDPSVRKALARLLTTFGMEIDTFESGLDFLLAAPWDGLDCLIVDLHMPRLTAIDVLRALPQINADLPALVVTAQGSPEMCSECIAAGAREVLFKPVDEVSLLAAIDRAVPFASKASAEF